MLLYSVGLLLTVYVCMYTYTDAVRATLVV